MIENIQNDILAVESRIAASGMPMKEIRDLMEKQFGTRLLANLNTNQLVEYLYALDTLPVKLLAICRHCGARKQ
jgi:hypothetical protein